MGGRAILVLNYEFPPLGGGASPVSYEIAKGYVKLGNSVDVVTMGFRGLPAFEKKDGINIYRIKCLRSRKEICHPWEQLTYVISAKNFLRKHLKTHSYDINHTHFIIPTGIVSLWLKKKYSLPYIITSHGSDVPGYNPDRFKFLHRFTKRLIREICTGAICITTPSRYLANLIKGKVGEYKVVIIPNGSRDFFDLNAKKENIIFSAGRLLPRKGFHLLIEVFNTIGFKDWRLYIAGDGPYKKTLMALASGNQNIIFTGWLDNVKSEYKKLLNKAKIFVLLSSRETQGIVLVEAMSAQCAILASNITACAETASEDVGFLVDREDEEEVKQKLELLMKDKNRTDEFMVHARERYCAHFRYYNINKKYDALLREVAL